MNLMVAVDANWGIGQGGDQLIYIPEDLKRFKALTTGHPVILGRKTLATFPKGRPLPNRRHLMLSRNPDLQVEGVEVYTSIEDLLAVAPEDSFIIGGGSVYQSLLPYCHTAYVTKIHQSWPADTWFPNLDDLPQWTVAEESPLLHGAGVDFQYVRYCQR